MSLRHGPGHHQPQRRLDGSVELTGFRRSLHGCLTGWGDALFELCDAAL